MSAAPVLQSQIQVSQKIESLLIGGDLNPLTISERVEYYKALCSSLGINPLTRPFEYIILNSKLTLYTKKDCTDQLRRVHKVSVFLKGARRDGDLYIVNAGARLPDGREDESTGVVNVKGLFGDALANAYMKAETKAKRRVTLSICGLNFVDESEIDSIKDAKIVSEDYVQDQPSPNDTKPIEGEIVSPPPKNMIDPESLSQKSAVFKMFRDFKLPEVDFEKIFKSLIDENVPYKITEIATFLNRIRNEQKQA